MGFEKLSLNDIKFSASGFSSSSSGSKSGKLKKAADYEPLLKFEKTSNTVSKKTKKNKKSASADAASTSKVSKSKTKKAKVSKGQDKISAEDEALYNEIHPFTIEKFFKGKSKKEIIAEYKKADKAYKKAQKAREKEYNTPASNGMTYEEAMAIIESVQSKHYGHFKYMKTIQSEGFNILRFDKEKMAKDDPMYAEALKARKEIEKNHPDVEHMWIEQHDRMLS